MSLRGSCLHLPPFILPIEGLLQDIGQSLWEVIWRATKELGPFGRPSEFSKHLDTEGQVLKQSNWRDVKRERAVRAMQAFSSVVTFVVEKHRRPSR